MTKLFNSNIPIYPIILTLSLIFYNTDYNTSYDDIRKYFDYQEFSTYLLFAIPFILFKSKVYYLLSLINKTYTKDQIESLLESHKISDTKLKKMQRFVDIVDDTEEDGINMASHEAYKFISKKNEQQFVKPILSNINISNLSTTLEHLDMNLNDDKISQILNQIQSDLKSN
ncbi:hypothetical protein CPAV1605_343 [seawater metagenome]|uniref:Uncharacterized protein n=1 Tax=seawater metagenome TaxID=1561972 RepID=A0A5E8CGS0_9ZZZZ